MRLTYAPLKKPKKMQYTITPPALAAGSQQKRTTPDAKLAAMIMLNTPTRSASRFGSVRPKTDAALMIESE
jgi:hypothetical protein